LLKDKYHLAKEIMDYSETMAENGRKGGYAKAEKYKPLIREVMRLFVTQPRMTQKQIAKRLGVSQAFVSEHTKSSFLKVSRYERLIKDIVGDLTDEEVDKILFKAKLEEKFLAHQEDVNTMKNHKRSKI
jgi:predicted transcriptional regulator